MTILKPNVPVALCSDHAGFATKQAVIKYFETQGIPYKDSGLIPQKAAIILIFAHPCAEAVEKGECYPGIAVCGRRRRHKHDAQQASGDTRGSLLDS